MLLAVYCLPAGRLLSVHDQKLTSFHAVVVVVGLTNDQHGQTTYFLK
jgi:hypothetical protein